MRPRPQIGQAGRGRPWLSLGLGLLLAWSASGYTYFLQYSSSTAPFGQFPAEFDLSVLPGEKVGIYVAETSADNLSAREPLPAMLNIIRDAAEVWNGVSTSRLRVAYSGMLSLPANSRIPAVEVYFEEMDPLTLGLTSVTPGDGLVLGASGTFRPIAKSVVRLNRDLNAWSGQPSFAEAFFLTVVHELGHSLGLQHTFTASAMATDVTRGTTLSQPLEADDTAGISVLYPVANYLDSNGQITGRITYQSTGQPVHLASVVAIRPSGAALSALTDADGRYRIAGVPPGQYLLYVHPLPSSGRAGAGAGDIQLPLDPNGQVVPATPPFDTVFFQGTPGTASAGTQDWLQATYLTVDAGPPAEDVSLSVRGRSEPAIGPVTIYRFFGQTAVRPAFVNVQSGGLSRLVAFGQNLASDDTPAAGLSFGFLGGTPVLAPNGLLAYSGSWLILDVQATSTFGGAGPRHGVFSLNGDLYVRPASIRLVKSDPPAIESVTATTGADGARRVVLTGKNLQPQTKFFFDGVRGHVLGFDETAGVTVAPPPGLAGSVPAVMAVNPDGQNSMFLQAATPPVFVYDSGAPGFVSISPSTLPAGGEAMVEINGVNTSFTAGLTTLGFGSPDVQVTKLWVLSPTRLLANVSVSLGGWGSVAPVHVMTGFQTIVQPLALSITAPSGTAPVVRSSLVNASPDQRGVYPGASVVLTGINLGTPQITLSGQPAQLVEVVSLPSGQDQVTFQVPQGLAPGPAVLRLTHAGESVSIVAAIEPPPPVILSVTNLSGARLEQGNPAISGDALLLTVSGLYENGSIVDTSRMALSVGGVPHPIVAATPVDGSDTVHVEFHLLREVEPKTDVPVTLSVDGRKSAAVVIPVRGQ